MNSTATRCALLLAAVAVPMAAADESSWRTVMNQIDAGGRMMYVMICLSVVALAFTIERLIRFRPARIVPRGFTAEMRSLWQARQFDAIIARCRAEGSCLARIIIFIVEHRTAPPEMVATNASDMGAREIRPHLAKITPLSLVATLAPLLGLVGTVYGMMGAFEQFRLLGETGDPGVFAGSISHMLVNTGAGLVIAAPCIAIHHLLRAWIARTSGRLEDEVSELINDWLVKRAGPED